MHNFYDEQTFYEGYTWMRKNTASANDYIERPFLASLLPDMKDKRILDLGCGMGSYILDFMSEAKAVDAVDISDNMLNELRCELERRSVKNVTIIKSSIEDLEFKADHYDVVLSTLAFHYIEDLGRIFGEIARSLKQDGLLIFDVEHPIYTASLDPGWEVGKDGTPAHWRVDNYFDSGRRRVEWLGIQVEKYHRTIEDYFHLLSDNGLRVLKLLEPKPSAEARRLDPELDRHHHRPPFLMISAVKL